MATARDIAWLGEIIAGYTTATNLSEISMVSAKLGHNIEAICQREYHRGFEDGKRAARKEIERVTNGSEG